MKTFSPTFGPELVAAGVGGLVTWFPDGSLQFNEGTTPEQQATIQSVADAHDPNAVVLVDKVERLRQAREVILNRLSGIALAAQLTGDTATTAAYVTVRQGLMDITANLPQDATVDALVMGRYAALVAQCTPQMITAFAQVDQ